MRGLPLTSAAIAALLCSLPADARADRAGFAEQVADSPSIFEGPRDSSSVDISGSFRARAENLYNLDLDRGLTPSGDPLFPVPLSDASGQSLQGANMRLRTDLVLRGPGTGMSVVLRTDVLDNLSVGSTPIGNPPSSRAGSPGLSPGQDAPIDAFRIKRAYGQAVTPLGILAVGRIGNNWGLGMVANGGDCDDCDSGDAADRVSFVSPLFGHVVALAYDIASTGPLTRSRDEARTIDLDPSDDARTFTLAFQKYQSPITRRRRNKAGLVNFEYGAYVSHRSQDRDVPADYLGGSDELVSSRRDLSASIADLWLYLGGSNFRVELEAAYSSATIGQASLVPGVRFYDEVTSQQLGAALESELHLGPLTLGLDAGYASGDPSPGFGAFADPEAGVAQPGDLDGAQANPPFDNQIDNFRFHSDYRVDKILFREIIGTVTDAAYLRPHLAVPLVRYTGLNIQFQTAAIASWAVEPSSTPSGSRPLGIEIDPGFRYQTSDGFLATLDYALLIPLSGLDNPDMGLDARSAQLLRLRLEMPF